MIGTVVMLVLLPGTVVGVTAYIALEGWLQRRAERRGAIQAAQRLMRQEQRRKGYRR